MTTLPTDDPLAVAVTTAIHHGDVATLRRLLVENTGLARARLGEACGTGGMSRSLLHVATDWPGHFPNGAATVAALVEAGADVNARFEGPHDETPLHWAASSDDVTVLDALLDAGADLEAPGAVVGGGTPLADAVAFGQWNAARRLLERGASTGFREAAGLGLYDRVVERFSAAAVAASSTPIQDELNQALWYACHGGQLRVAQLLLERGAHLDWVGWNDQTPLDVARRSGALDVVAWLEARGARSASSIGRADS